MEKIIHRARTRGHANHGWLETYHTFSFANYYDPARIRFGTLRVLNDDIVAGGEGFGTHPHDNMEIVTIPLEGDLEHRDNMGNTSVIRRGEVQVMSAGTGITHSEYNHNQNRPVKLLQIWVFPDRRGVEPRYGQARIDAAAMQGRFIPIVGPRGEGAAVWIYQDAWFNLAEAAEGETVEYRLRKPEHGAYVFIIKGEVEVADERLGERDGMGITGAGALEFKALTPAEILVVEVPMD